MRVVGQREDDKKLWAVFINNAVSH